MIASASLKMSCLFIGSSSKLDFVINASYSLFEYLYAPKKWFSVVSKLSKNVKGSK